MNPSYSSWHAIDIGNKKLAMSIASKVDIRCAVFSSNLKVRGYSDLLFHRAIYEFKAIQESPELLVRQNACASVFVEGALAFPDLPKYTKATITDQNGFTTTFTNEEIL